jgi:hypothetical protein
MCASTASSNSSCINYAVRRRLACCLVALALPRLRHGRDYSRPGCTGSTFNHVVCHDYSSLGCTGSTSTLSCAVVPLDFLSVGRTGSRHAPGHCISRRDYSSSGLHRLYCAYVMHPDAPSRCSTSRRSAALALAVRPVTASRGTTNRRPDCTGSTAPMPCIRTRRLTARLLVGRSHWLSSCARSLRLAARLLVVRIAPALLRLCRGSGRTVSPLDFSSVGRTGSHRASRGATTHRPDCAGSTAPMPCIRTHCLDTRLLVSR